MRLLNQFLSIFTAHFELRDVCQELRVAYRRLKTPEIKYRFLDMLTDLKAKIQLIDIILMSHFHHRATEKAINQSVSLSKIVDIYCNIKVKKELEFMEQFVVLLYHMVASYFRYSPNLGAEIPQLTDLKAKLEEVKSNILNTRRIEIYLQCTLQVMENMIRSTKSNKNT